MTDVRNGYFYSFRSIDYTKNYAFSLVWIRRPAKILQEMTEYSRRPCGSESYDRPKHAAKASKHPGAEMSADVVIRKFREDSWTSGQL